MISPLRLGESTCARESSGHVDDADLEETTEILSDPSTVAAIEQGLDEIERGEAVPLVMLSQELATARGARD